MFLIVPKQKKIEFYINKKNTCFLGKQLYIESLFFRKFSNVQQIAHYCI